MRGTFLYDVRSRSRRRRRRVENRFSELVSSRVADDDYDRSDSSEGENEDGERRHEEEEEKEKALWPPLVGRRSTGMFGDEEDDKDGASLREVISVRDYLDLLTSELRNLSIRVENRNGNAKPEAATKKTVKFVQGEYTAGSDDRECMICQDQFRPGQALAVLECTHRFCIECIRDWAEVKPECPICRNRIELGEAEKGKHEGNGDSE